MLNSARMPSVNAAAAVYCGVGLAKRNGFRPWVRTANANPSCNGIPIAYSAPVMLAS